MGALQAATPRTPGGELAESDDEWQAGVLAAAAAAAEQAVPVLCTPTGTAVGGGGGDETPVARSMAPNPTPDPTHIQVRTHPTTPLDFCTYLNREATGGSI